MVAKVYGGIGAAGYDHQIVPILDNFQTELVDD